MNRVHEWGGEKQNEGTDWAEEQTEIMLADRIYWFYITFNVDPWIDHLTQEMHSVATIEPCVFFKKNTELSAGFNASLNASLLSWAIF